VDVNCGSISGHQRVVEHGLLKSEYKFRCQNCLIWGIHVMNTYIWILLFLREKKTGTRKGFALMLVSC